MPDPILTDAFYLDSEPDLFAALSCLLNARAEEAAGKVCFPTAARGSERKASLSAIAKFIAKHLRTA